MIKYIILFSVAAVTSFLITPIIQQLAKKLNILDYPSERKIHKKPIPRLGGIPIFIAFNLTIAIGFLINFEYFKEFYSTKGISILISQLVILGIGIYDDIKRVKPVVKLFFQIMAGSLLMIFGFNCATM